MKTVLKWIGIATAILVALIIVAAAALYIYVPDLRNSWVKPGIRQEEIPAGVVTSVVFENVTVVPMDSERTLEEQTVLINDGRIAELGTGGEIDIPADTHVVDGTGKFLIPGLGDMHVHWRGAENDMLVYLANGVTLIRTMGGETPAILEYRDEINAGTRIGPSIKAWWPSIETDVFGGGDPEWIREFQTRGGETYVHTPAEAEQLVAEAAALGVDGIKSHYVVPTGVFLALMESAAEHDLPFDGHIPADHASCRPDKPECVCARPDCWNDFRSMEAPALAHVEELIKVVDLVDENSRQASDESIRQIAQDAADDGLWVTTTLFLMRSIADQAADLEGTLATMPEVKYVHPRVFDTGKWGPGKNFYVETGSRPWWPEYVAAQEKMMQALNEQGGLIMSGTDATTPVMVPGFSLHDELETLVDVGLSPYDVLRTSTYNPALYLGELEEFGTVEVGKRADLVLLEANPLDDIANTRQIAGTMVRGRYYSRAALDLMLEEVAKDNETADTTQTIVKIAFPIVVVLLLVVLAWFVVSVVQKRKASQDSS